MLWLRQSFKQVSTSFSSKHSCCKSLSNLSMSLFVLKTTDYLQIHKVKLKNNHCLVSIVYVLHTNKNSNEKKRQKKQHLIIKELFKLKKIMALNQKQSYLRDHSHRAVVILYWNCTAVPIICNFLLIKITSRVAVTTNLLQNYNVLGKHTSFLYYMTKNPCIY